jgi:tRNA-Thr(GGU) m(6)t(6)A37 methyltransferase TsaA
MQKIVYRPIGVVTTPFKDRASVPRQADRRRDIKASIEIFDEFSEGLADLAGFSHIIVIFHLHRIKDVSLKAWPPCDDREHGVFATRSPHRPNPVGLSVVRLDGIDKNILKISGADMIDGTPVLDIKPYIPDLNPDEDVRIGWLADRADRRKSPDG